MSGREEKASILPVMEAKDLNCRSERKVDRRPEAGKLTSAEPSVNRPDFSHSSWEEIDESETLDAP
jgi:hypothetical protein